MKTKIAMITKAGIAGTPPSGSDGGGGKRNIFFSFFLFLCFLRKTTCVREKMGMEEETKSLGKKEEGSESSDVYTKKGSSCIGM